MLLQWLKLEFESSQGWMDRCLCQWCLVSLVCESDGESEDVSGAITTTPSLNFLFSIVCFHPPILPSPFYLFFCCFCLLFHFTACLSLLSFSLPSLTLALLHVLILPNILSSPLFLSVCVCVCFWSCWSHSFLHSEPVVFHWFRVSKAQSNQGISKKIWQQFV